MLEHEMQEINIPEFPLHDKKRVFPPTGNRERLSNVMEGFVKLAPSPKEVTAPWKKDFLQAEIPMALTRLELAGMVLLEDLKPFNPGSPKEQYRFAKTVLKNETANLQISASHKNDIDEAKQHAFIHIVERACNGSDMGSYYRHQGQRELSESTKDVIKTAQRYFVWETIKDASQTLQSYANPFESLFDLHQLGANRVRVTDEGVLIIMKVKTTDGIGHVPYLIERE